MAAHDDGSACLAREALLALDSDDLAAAMAALGPDGRGRLLGVAGLPGTCPRGEAPALVRSQLPHLPATAVHDVAHLLAGPLTGPLLAHLGDDGREIVEDFEAALPELLGVWPWRLVELLFAVVAEILALDARGLDELLRVLDRAAAMRASPSAASNPPTPD